MKSFGSLLWMISIAIAFAAGYYWQIFTGPSLSIQEQFTDVVNKPEGIAYEQQALTSIDTNRKVLAATSTNLHASKDSAGKSIAQDNPMYRQVFRILQNNDGHDLETIIDAYNLLSQLTETELLNNLKSLSLYEDNPKYAQTLKLFMERYASLAPLNALGFVLDNIHTTQVRENLVNISLAKWSKNEPEQALDWYNNNQSEFTGKFNRSLSHIFKALAEKDKDLALTHLDAYVHDGQALTNAINGLTRALSDTSDYIDLLNKTASLDNKKIQNSIIVNWFGNSPSDALDWFTSLPDSKNKLDTEKLIFSRYMFSDPNAAADWYIANASNSSKQTRADEIVGRWSYSNPEKALDWVSMQVNIDQQKAISKLLAGASYRNPNFVIQNMDLVKSDKQKANISYRIFTALQKESEQRAQEFLAGSSYKKEILKSVANMERYRNRELNK